MKTLPSTGGLLQLTQVRLAQVRKFEQLQLTLAPGLNIIAGPNGAGKSTLARAIRAAFLTRYSSTSGAADLLPLGHSTAAPTVELDFMLHGMPHQLVKTFLKKKRCDLRMGAAGGSASTKSEQDAENYLAEALGFGFGKRGDSAENWGVPGLLWVEQGFALSALSERIGYASARLGAALHAQAGDAPSVAGGLAATAGDALIAQLEKSLEALVTRGTRKPTGAYAEAQRELEEKTALLAAQRQRVAEYRQQVDELSQLLAQEQQQAAARPEQQWQTELAHARAQAAAAQALAQRHQQAQQQLGQLEESVAALARELQLHSQQQRKLQERAQATEAAQQVHAAAVQALHHARAAREVAAQQAEAAQRQWQAAQQGRERAQLQERWTERMQQRQRVQAHCTEAQQMLQKMQLLTQALSALGIEKTDIQKLRLLDDAVRTTALQRDAMATSLQFELPAGQTLDWQAGDAQGQWQRTGQQWLDRATAIGLPGGGRLRITPGGEAVAGVAARHQAAEAALQQALARLQVASVADAQAQWEQRQQLESEHHLAQQLWARQAPQGLEALQRELEQLSAQVQALGQQVELLPPAAADAPVPDWALAQAAWTHATQAGQRAQEQERVASQQEALAAQQAQQSQAEQAAAAQALQDPAVQARQTAAQQQITLREAERVQLEQQIATDAQALQGAAGRFAAQDIERLERSLLVHAQQVQARTLRVTQLRAALESAGAQGLEEANAVLEGDRAHLQHRVGEMQRRAQALMVVVDRLKAKRAAALRRLQAPLEAHMQHYLQLLLPGGRMELDAQLVPRSVVAPEGAHAAARRVAGAMEDLSYGTQEQLGILGRLAYADLLRDAGQPTLLMLDDSLVFSDAERLGQMKRALFDAAQRHQLLLFTCHPEWWQDMGVPVQMLPETI